MDDSRLPVPVLQLNRGSFRGLDYQPIGKSVPLVLLDV